MSCSICTQNFNCQPHVLECGHAFHHMCILEWFRYGNDTCPMCRDNTISMTPVRTTARFENLMQMSKTSKAPMQLKHLCSKYNNLKKDIKKTIFAEKEFKKIHRDILCKSSRYIHKINKLKRKEKKLYMRIGMFTHPQCPLPLMIRRKLSRS